MRRTVCTTAFVTIAAVGLARTSAAQAPASRPQSPPPAPAAKPPAPPVETYVYQPDGRRDPFISLLNTGTESSSAKRAEGPGSMSVGEISVRGVIQTRGALIAMIQGPDKKTYIVHQGDKLLDGSIKTITPRGLICVQDVNDPLSLVKQREVSKPLRSLEAVKP